MCMGTVVLLINHALNASYNWGVIGTLAGKSMANNNTNDSESIRPYEYQLEYSLIVLGTVWLIIMLIEFGSNGTLAGTSMANNSTSDTEFY